MASPDAVKTSMRRVPALVVMVCSILEPGFAAAIASRAAFPAV